MIDIKETDLYLPVKNLLISNNYEVKGEVKDCDIAAVKGDELLIVELKKSLSVELLVQAAKRQKMTSVVYIAVPKPKKMTVTKKWKDIIHLIRRLELGLILVSFRGDAGICEIVLEPDEFSREKSLRVNLKTRERLVKEFQGRGADSNVGGSCRTKIVTSYREKAIFIACCLDEFGELSTKELRGYGTDKEMTTSILYDNHYGWFGKVSRGKYKLSETGKKELNNYNSFTDYYREKILNMKSASTE